MASSVLRRPCMALLLPDSGKTPSKPGRLIIPGQRPPPTTPMPLQQPVTESTEGDAKRTYRPPMGYFMKSKEATEEATVEAEVMIQRLSAGVGLWHSLATYLPQLNAAGYDAQLLEQMTGIAKGEQSILITAVSVLQSIKAFCKKHGTADSDEDMLQFFDMEGTHFMLYELRFLDIEERVMCARYTAERQLDAPDTRDLARSTKEYHRRGAEETGFSPTPQDILAYKFYRNALESREQKVISSFVQKGLDIAQSDRAKEKLQGVLTEHEKIQETKDAVVSSKVRIYRLLSDETRVRLLPYAGDLFEIGSGILLNCPKAKSTGEFSVFDIVESDGVQHHWKWIALPNWASLSHAKHPVALSIKNCAHLPELRSSVSAKSKDEALRLTGSGMLVADIAEDNTDPQFFYLINHSGQPKLKPGHQLADDEVIGKVLFVCRPPDKDSEF